MFSKFRFPKFKIFVFSSVFPELQLLQISLNFETYCCNLKIRGLGKKSSDEFFCLCFVMRYFILNSILLLSFKWKKIIECNSWQERNLWISSQTFIVIYYYYDGMFILFWKSIYNWILSTSKFKQGNFLAVF